MRIGFVGSGTAFPDSSARRRPRPRLARTSIAGAAAVAVAVGIASHAAATELLSEDVGGLASGGAGFNRNPGSPMDISPDGRFVVFTSTAADLIAGVTDTNAAADVFLRDLALDTTAILSVTADGTALGTTGNNAIRDLVFSPDSKHLLFRTQATGIVDGLADTNSAPDWFVRDLVAGTTECISVNAMGTATGNSTSASSHLAVFSPDGSAVAFSSLAGDLVFGLEDLSGRDLFLRVLEEQTTILVSAAVLGAPVGGVSDDAPRFSPDGRYLAFVTVSSGIDPDATDTNSATDIYVRDLATATSDLVSRTPEPDVAATGAAAPSEWAADGHAILFASAGTGLVPGVADTNGGNDLFLWHLESLTVEIVSVDAAGTSSGNKISRSFGMDPGSRFVAFGSASTNLTAESAGGDVKDDLYVRDTLTGATTYVARNETASVFFALVKFSPDAVHLLFETDQSDTVDGLSDTNGQTDLFSYDLLTGDIDPVTVNFSGTATANNAGTSDDDVVLSPNGRYLSFVSDATDLVPDFERVSTRDLYVRDLVGGVTTLVTEGLDGKAFGYDQAATRDAEFTPDSRFLVLTTRSALKDQVTTPFNFNFSNNLYAYDVELHERTLMSVNAAGTAPAGAGVVPFELGVEPFSFLVNPDGRSVVFLSTAADMVAGTADVAQTMDFFQGNLPETLDPCGDPVFDPATPGTIKASDALYVLKAGVGSSTCEPCVCDVNNNGSISAGDGLATLKVAVGQDVELQCPACGP